MFHYRLKAQNSSIHFLKLILIISCLSLLCCMYMWDVKLARWGLKMKFIDKKCLESILTMLGSVDVEQLIQEPIHMLSTWNFPRHIDIFKTIWQLNGIRKGASITWSSVHVLFTCNHHGRPKIIFMYSKTEVDWLPWFQSFFCHDTYIQELALKRNLIITNLLRLVLIFVVSYLKVIDTRLERPWSTTKLCVMGFLLGIDHAWSKHMHKLVLLLTEQLN